MGSFLAILLWAAPCQDPLDAILKRLEDDSFEERERAQKELESFVEADERAERLRKALPRLELDGRQRAERALQVFRQKSDGWIAYIRRDGTQEVWVVRPDGTEPRALTKDLDVDFNMPPAWSPDGRRIVFLRESHLYAVDADGKNLKPLTRGDTQNSGASWRPDGKAIVFSSYFFDKKDNSGTSRWMAIDPDGSALREVPAPSGEWRRGERTFSPDGKHRADDFAGQIFVTDLDGRNSRNLTDKQENRGPRWSPDGKWIAYTSHRDERPRLFVIGADGKEEREVAGGLGWGASWSPDSRRLAFSSTQPGLEGICVIDLDGKNHKLLTDAKAHAPSWSPSTLPRRGR